MTTSQSLQNKRLEDSNWSESDSIFHVFNNQNELKLYLNRSKTGRWWREEYGRFDFEQCAFNFNVNHWEVSVFEDAAFFNYARFEKDVNLSNVIFKEIADFRGCEFLGDVNFSNCIFEKEFYPASKHNSVSFFNVTFNEHVTFSRTIFEGNVNFNQSNFKNGFHFYDLTFRDELFFADSKISGDSFFENIDFNEKVNGWNMVFFNDISFKWANFRKKANFSDMKVENGDADFHGSNFENNAYFYGCRINQLDLSKSVIEKNLFFLGSIINNANRETWRIIKHEFIKQNNQIESLSYHTLEMRSFENELFGARESFILDFFKVFYGDNKSDKAILFLNRISNGYKTRPFRGIVFTFVATIFTYLLFMLTLKVENSLIYHFSLKNIGLNLKQIFQLMNLANWDYHPFGYDYNFAYVFLFFGRIFIGFGIYQTIQAFRKYGR